MCILCQQRTHRDIDLCIDCETLCTITKFTCVLCGVKIRDSAAEICEICQKKKPIFDQLITAFEYDMPIDFLITRFKFHENLVYGKVLRNSYPSPLFNIFKIFLTKNPLNIFFLYPCILPV